MIEMFFNDINEIKYDVAFFTCQHCFISQSFDNKNELKNYVLNIHQFGIRFFEIIRRLQQTNNDEHTKKHVYNFFSLSFMRYAIIQTSIFDWNFTSCLNINENVFLCDSNFVFRDRDVYNFVKRVKFIIIIEIVDMKILNKYIEKKVLLNFNKIFVIIKIYLIKDFQFDLIIDMNVLMLWTKPYHWLNKRETGRVCLRAWHRNVNILAEQSASYPSTIIIIKTTSTCSSAFCSLQHDSSINSMPIMFSSHT